MPAQMGTAALCGDGCSAWASPTKLYPQESLKPSARYEYIPKRRPRSPWVYSDYGRTLTPRFPTLSRRLPNPARHISLGMYCTQIYTVPFSAIKHRKGAFLEHGEGALAK